MIHRRKLIQLMAGGAMMPFAGRAAAGRSQDWRHYGGDLEASRYSSLSQITTANVSDLKMAWVHHSAPENSRYRGSVECTPLVVDGIMYIVGADLVV
jgi:quinoprotein glucose dehydrogenase